MRCGAEGDSRWTASIRPIPRRTRATRYDGLTHDEAIARDLKVMDTAAFALARENRLPIIVGSAHGASSITSILKGKVPSTRVSLIGPDLDNLNPLAASVSRLRIYSDS